MDIPKKCVLLHVFSKTIVDKDRHPSRMKGFYKIFAIAVLLIATSVMNAQSRDFSFDNSAPKEGLSVESNTRAGLTMRHALKLLSLLNITDNGYTGDVIQGCTGISLPANEGEPNLPSFSRFVAIPNGATAHIEMGYRSMTTIQDVDLMAAAPIKFDTDDSPDTHERKQSIYGKNAFFPESPVTVSEPFSLRGVQTVAVTVVPFQYNPVTKELRVYDDLQFDVRFDGGNGEFGDTRLRSPYWDPILMQNLANYNQLPVINYEARMQEWVNNRPTGCEYLIVIPNNEGFRQYANQLRDYRIQQGILTEVKSLSEMSCTTTNMMKSYFHNAYNTWDIPPVAVLLLGDHSTNMANGIPAETTYHSPSYGNCITDNGYADVTGDLLPEMAFSRLVAANADEAQMMVSKQIEYEYTNPNTEAYTYNRPITALGWQTQRWFQLCSETIGGYWRNQGRHPVRINAIYSGTPGTQWSTNLNTYILVNYFGPNGLSYIPTSPYELGGWTGGTAEQVVTAVNNGCMLLQHRDHGRYQGWGEPDFSNSDVALMNNVGRMTFVNTINCQTGTFDYGSNCLIEAFMRRTSNGQNAGAVGCIGPTQSTYSFVNDTYAWGLFDQYDPQFLPDYGPYASYEGNWRPAFGNVAGKYFLQQSSWPMNTDEKGITHKMFTAHCDAFLTLFTQVPTAMNVIHPAQIPATTSSINVTAPQGAVIALTCNNTILAVANATGNSQIINFPAQPSNDYITIVATKQDRLRYVGTIQIISEPNLSITAVNPNDANGNLLLEYGEQSSLDLCINNIGNIASAVATATLSTTTPLYVSISDNTASIPALTPNQSANLADVFSFTVSDNVPNESHLEFVLTMNDGGHTWTEHFTLNAYAPLLNINELMTIDDFGSVKTQGNGNRRLDPGETAELTFNYINNGGATANNITATLSTITPQYVTISNPTIITPTVGPSQNVQLTYTVSVDALVPLGETAVFNLDVVSGNYANHQTFEHRVGLETANFENGLDGFEWENDPEHPWTITTTAPYAGSYCLRSGVIEHNATSTLSLLYNVENPNDEIHFVRRTDCQHNGDYLRFYIDGNMMQEWTGALYWHEVSFPVPQGEHTFTWTYEKNDSGSSGQDCVWIDEILFPAKHIIFACNAGNDLEHCQETVQLNAEAVGYETLLWTTTGDGTFSEANILNPTYTPGEQDLTDKQTVLTLTATSAEGETLSDHVIIHFHEAASIVLDDEADICEGSSITLSATTEEAGFSVWTTDGDGSFSNTAALETNYTPGEQDIANGMVTLSLKAPSPYGCGDANHDFKLRIHPINHTDFSMEACGSYNWNGIEYVETGDYEQTLQSIYGCDSIVTMHLTLIEAYQTEVEATACELYEWGGETFVESGVYEHTFTSMHGCDSTVMLHLIINRHDEVDFLVDTCDSFEWNGIEYTESGLYQGTFTNAMGCDSIVSMLLHITRSPEAITIEGSTLIDAYQTPSESYAVACETVLDYVEWNIIPETAGVIEPEGLTTSILWNTAFTGEAVIKVKAGNTCGEIESEIAVNVVTNVNEHLVQANIYPNPTQGQVTIEAYSLKSVAVSNTLGQILITEETESNEIQLNLSQFASGIYLIHIRTDNGIATKRVNLIR